MELAAFDRTQAPAALRADGMLPAIVYDKKTNRSVYVERKAFDKAFRKASTNSVITLKFEGGESVDILVKAVSMNKKKRIVEHADFLIVSDEPVDVHVAVHTTGVSADVKAGAMLDMVMHNVVVKASPKNLPHEIIVDITNLTLGHPVHASDLVMPEGVKLVSDPTATVLMLQPARAAEEVVPVVAAAAEPEVIKKGKQEDK
jgi:large subunit ribosomal protein L25